MHQGQTQTAVTLSSSTPAAMFTLSCCCCWGAKVGNWWWWCAFARERESETPNWPPSRNSLLSPSPLYIWGTKDVNRTDPVDVCLLVAPP